MSEYEERVVRVVEAITERAIQASQEDEPSERQEFWWALVALITSHFLAQDDAVRERAEVRDE
mgnify:CR=1 FL=1